MPASIGPQSPAASPRTEAADACKRISREVEKLQSINPGNIDPLSIRALLAGLEVIRSRVDDDLLRTIKVEKQKGVEAAQEKAALEAAALKAQSKIDCLEKEKEDLQDSLTERDEEEQLQEEYKEELRKKRKTNIHPA